MCGRYVVEGHQELSERFQLRQIPFAILPTFNAAPSKELPVVVEDDNGERVLRPMRWGLLPRWRKPGQANSVAPINARAETLLEKPMFRGLTKAKRCIVPASGFYEWRKVDGRKQPYYLTSEDGEAWGLAGLYDLTHEDENDAAGSFTIITTPANSLVAPLHDRMPAILRPEDEADWLSRDLADPHAAQALLRPYPAEAMAADLVSPAVNNPRNDGPELIAPVEQTA